MRERRSDTYESNCNGEGDFGIRSSSDDVLLFGVEKREE